MGWLIFGTHVVVDDARADRIAVDVHGGSQSVEEPVDEEYQGKEQEHASSPWQKCRSRKLVPSIRLSTAICEVELL